MRMRVPKRSRCWRCKTKVGSCRLPETGKQPKKFSRVRSDAPDFSWSRRRALIEASYGYGFRFVGACGGCTGCGCGCGCAGIVVIVLVRPSGCGCGCVWVCGWVRPGFVGVTGVIVG